MKNIEKKRILEKAKQIPPVVHIGKFGITPELLNEIEIQLKKKKIVKIKMLKNFVENRDRFGMAEQIAAKTNSELIDIRGFVIVLYKR